MRSKQLREQLMLIIKISHFSAYDVFDDEKLNILKRIADDEIPTAKIVDSLAGSLSDVFSIDELIRSLQKTVQQIQTDLSIIVEPGVDTGIVIHLAFMLDGLIKQESHRQFEKLSIFSKIYRLEMDIVRANLMALERKYQVKIPEDDIAFLTQMFLENKIKNEHTNHTVYTLNICVRTIKRAKKHENAISALFYWHASCVI